VKIGGERAYKLHRAGVAVEMPVRVMRIRSVALLAYDDGVARVALDVGSGTYVRSIADALGGHCTELRRTSVGPFTVEEADPDRVIALDEALARLREDGPR
jgi:tRNA pseudouridine55 synthase